MDNKLTPVQQRANDEWRLLLLIAEIIDEAHDEYASTGGSLSRNALFTAGLYADAVDRLRVRVLRLGIVNNIPEVERLSYPVTFSHCCPTPQSRRA